MIDADGRTVRHDMQYEDDHREDVPYTIQDAVWFCLEMLEDIWDYARTCIVPDTDYLSELRRNKTLLSDLLVREWMPES